MHLIISLISWALWIIPFSWLLNAFIISSLPRITSPCPLVKWAQWKCQEPSWANRAGPWWNGENLRSYQSSWFPNIFHRAAQSFDNTQKYKAWLSWPLKSALKFLKGLFKWIFLGIFFISDKKPLSCFTGYNAYILLDLQTHSLLFRCQTNLSPAFIYFKRGFYFAAVRPAVHTKIVKAYRVLTVFISIFCNCFQIHCNVFFSCSAILH